ncbi:MAG: hypothetical protein J5666_08750 [Bacilli bacterium]|nr:hypothetical protein [Bacilli bacterium]
MKNLFKVLTKVFSLLLVVLMVFALVGCGDTPSPTPNPDPDPNPNPNPDPDPKEHEWTENELFWDSDKNGIPDWQEKEITLTYATWQYGSSETVTIDTLLIEEFMKKYPNIHVEMQIIEGLEEAWEANFLTLMETEEIPDVFLIHRLENLLDKNVLADLTDFYNHDEDTQYLFESVRDLGLYKGRRYCLPTFVYPEIWIVNLDLLEDCNIDAPGYDWTWDQMEAIAKAVYAARGTQHAIGIYGTDEYYFELPKIMKIKDDAVEGSKWLAYGYCNDTFNFSDDAYIRAMSKLETGLSEGWLSSQIGEEQLMEYYGSILDPRYSGQVAIWRQPSWEFKDHMADIQFRWDVYPGPSGVTGGNTDIAGIYQLSENKAAAYQLLKWMSWGEDGMVTRYRLYDEYGSELYVSANNYPYPVVDYGINGDGENLIWDNIPYTQSANGYGAPEFVESLRGGAIKANKEVIGWDAADEVFQTYIYQIVMEGAKYSTLYSTIQELSDAALKQKRDAVDAMTGK